MNRSDPRAPTLPLQGTSRRVRRIGLGAMHLSLPGRPDRPDAIRVVQRAVELGTTLIDTADAYALDDREHGHGEVLVADALREMGVDPQHPDAPIVATKGGRSRPGGEWALDARPERIREACHASLRRMRLERLPLYQLHQPDPDVPLEDSVGALARLREEGKVEAVGLSNVRAEELREAREIVPIASVQNAFSPWSADGGVPTILTDCERDGLLYMAYSPLGGRPRAASLSDVDPLDSLARRLQVTSQELVLAWLLTISPVLVPIPGARRIRSVESSARAAALTLEPAVLREVERALRSLPGRAGVLRRLARRAVSAVRRVLP